MPSVPIYLFDEGRAIYDAIESLVELEVTAAGSSTDDSAEWACKAAVELPNVRVIRNAVKGIDAAVRASRAEVIVDLTVVARFTSLRDRGGRRPDLFALDS